MTYKEAKQLACAIKLFLDDATVVNALFLWGEKDRGLTIKTLRRYMSKKGGIMTLPYSAIKDDPEFFSPERSSGDNPNARAKRHLKRADKYNEEISFWGEDLSTSIGGAMLRYSRNQDGSISGKIRDHYTFLDEKGTAKSVTFPYLTLEGFLCCWKGGDWISDLWMGDLEKHGLAKSFFIHIDLDIRC